jgi:hypothetical protein
MLHELEIPQPESTDPKEVFAFFGLAMYEAQVFEKNVLHFVVLCEMLELPAGTREGVNRFYEKFDSCTLGKLLRIARGHDNFDPLVEPKLRRALDGRNVLVHQYFWNNAEKFCTDDGRLNMIHELRDSVALFKDADNDLTNLFFSLSERVGITQQKVEELYNEIFDRIGS